MYIELYKPVKGWPLPSYSSNLADFKLDYLPEEGSEEIEAPSEGHSLMNVKMFKMIFNRALRIKSRDG